MTTTALSPLQNAPSAGAVDGQDGLAVYCRNVTKIYQAGTTSVTALGGVDLEVATGELMMLVGPSGCGKTTLISVVAGILDQNGGECRVFGHDFKNMPSAAKTRYRGQTIGFVFQQFNLLPSLSAAENAAVPLLINGVKRREAIARAGEMLNKVGLGDRAHSLPSQLSGGQQQRVAIARALVHDPRLVVCDEPTSALDAETGHKVMQLLRDVALREGRALVIVTHDARIFEFADRIARMNDGRIEKVVRSPKDWGLPQETNMIRKLFIPILAALGVVVAIITVVKGNRPAPVSLPVAEPARAPYASYIAGSGIVEASTENIQIGTIISGVVTEVFVKVGSQVKKGDPLFKIDDRDQQAELAVRQAALDASNAKLQKVTSSPRPEDVPVYEAKLHASQAALEDASAQWKLYEDIGDARAVSRDEMNKRRFAVQLQEANVRQAQADLDELKAGAWKPDVDIAHADVSSAEALLKQTRTEIDRRTVRALVDGQVLQVNVRPGEFAFAGNSQSPLMLLGNTRTLHVRVDIDENDAWRFSPDREATAYVRGNREKKTLVKFVRTEPYVLPKKSLTGDSTERVDTRVLQVLYSFENGVLPVYVGQQLDVFIDAPPIAGQSTTQPATGAPAAAGGAR